MSTSLYDLSVASFLQTVGAVAGYLEKGRAHLTANGVDLDQVLETRLFADMLPFRFQVLMVAHHSLGAIEGVKKGQFFPPANVEPLDYQGLQKLIADTRDALQKMQPGEVNALEGRDVSFKIRELTIPFTAENFLMSFSLPNLHFHATTAYDILRMKGVPVGKRDYLGQMRIKSAGAGAS
jgi:hypothetical protein